MGDAAVERRGASAATGSGDFGRSSKPCSIRSSCARSSCSLCAPKSRRISASTFSRSSLFSVRNSASSSLTRAFSAVARASFSLSSFCRSGGYADGAPRCGGGHLLVTRSRGVSSGIARIRHPRRSNVHLFLRRCANTLTPSRPRPFICAHTTAASLPCADRSRRSASPAPQRSLTAKRVGVVWISPSRLRTWICSRRGSPAMNSTTSVSSNSR